jgi:hypothetical protein
MALFQELLAGKLNVEIIEMPGPAPFYKMLWSLWFGLWTSYHLALLNGIDPTPVELVEKFKRKMAEENT